MGGDLVVEQARVVRRAELRLRVLAGGGGRSRRFRRGHRGAREGLPLAALVLAVGTAGARHLLVGKGSVGRLLWYDAWAGRLGEN